MTDQDYRERGDTYRSPTELWRQRGLEPITDEMKAFVAAAWKEYDDSESGEVLMAHDEAVLARHAVKEITRETALRLELEVRATNIVRLRNKLAEAERQRDQAEQMLLKVWLNPESVLDLRYFLDERGLLPKEK